jgi:dTDP-4-amino-4,6-dideoxygalactose transaminase
VYPPVSPSVFFRRPRQELPFPLADPRCRVFYRARHGLWHAVRAHSLEPGDEVLVPDYHHGSEIEALVRAGLRPRFYGCDDQLEPDLAQLETLLNPRVRILYLIHYLGFPQDVLRWRRWADAHRLLLVEDAAQSWLSERDSLSIGSLSDIAIFCLYKTLGMSAGGAVVSSPPVDPPAGVPGRGVRDLGFALRRWRRQRWDPRQSYTRPTDVSDFELGDPESAPTRGAMFVVAREADPAIASRRRANYRALLNDLGSFVPRPFSTLPDGASPLQFPVQVRDKPAVLDRLAQAGVEGSNMWPVAHPLLEDDQSERTRELRSTLVGLPVHHGLGEPELARVAQAARSALAGPKTRQAAVTEHAGSEHPHS